MRVGRCDSLVHQQPVDFFDWVSFEEGSESLELPGHSCRTLSEQLKLPKP